MRLVAGVHQRASQLLYSVIDAVVELDNRVVGPKSLANFVATDDLAVGFDQDAQDLEGLVGENQDSAIILAQFAGAQVDFKDTEAHPLGQGSFHGSVSRRDWARVYYGWLFNEKNLAERQAPEPPTNAALKGRSFSCAVPTAFIFSRRLQPATLFRADKQVPPTKVGSDGKEADPTTQLKLHPFKSNNLRDGCRKVRRRLPRVPCQ
jgi:hypothetical protein